MKPNILYLLAATLILPLSASATADSLYPLRGETKSQIQKQYGEPQTIRGPVGDPPITRWIYNDFTVVFEYDRALDAFPRRPDLENRPSSSIPPRPDPSRGDTLNMPE